MKSILLSDSKDIITGLRLAGVKGVYCKDKEDLKKNLYAATHDNNIEMR